MSATLTEKPAIKAPLQSDHNAREFLMRRLHSLAGLFPMSLFLVFHLSANNSAVKGPEAFNQVVGFLRGLPYVELIEISILGIPFIFHGLYGLIITPQVARVEPGKYAGPRSWAYFMQRLTGIAAFIFIAVHIYQFRFNENLDFEAVASALRQPAWAIAYLAGVTAIIYHFANGLWNFCISWGITIGPAAQRNSAFVCAAVGVGVLALGYSALWAFYSSLPAQI